MEFGAVSALFGFLFVSVTMTGFVDAEVGVKAQPQFEFSDIYGIHYLSDGSLRVLNFWQKKDEIWLSEESELS